MFQNHISQYLINETGLRFSPKYFYYITADRQPVMIIGNKVDLLPMDSWDALSHLKKALTDVVKLTCLEDANIIDTLLISSTTGYGIEELISSIQQKWHNRGKLLF